MVNISQDSKTPPELKIGDGKEKKRFEVNGWIKGLKDFAINVII